MAESIIRGTTPSFIVDFSELLPLLSTNFPEDTPTLSVIEQVSLIQVQGRTIKDLSEGLIYDNIEKTISYHFSQEETFEMKRAAMICFQMDIWVAGEAYRVVDRLYEVEDSHRTKVFAAE